jgi:hypothetical protein
LQPALRETPTTLEPNRFGIRHLRSITKVEKRFQNISKPFISFRVAQAMTHDFYDQGLGCARKLTDPEVTLVAASGEEIVVHQRLKLSGDRRSCCRQVRKGS